jgi:hypothetical protein
MTLMIVSFLIRSYLEKLIRSIHGHFVGKFIHQNVLIEGHSLSWKIYTSKRADSGKPLDEVLTSD